MNRDYWKRPVQSDRNSFGYGNTEAGDEWWFGGENGEQIVIRPAGGSRCSSLCVMGRDSRGDDLADANARLIAAAPELLASLKAIRANLPSNSSAYRIADQAIAKATHTTKDATP